MGCRITILTSICLGGICLWGSSAAAAGKGKFVPAICEHIAAVEEQFERALLKTGKPADRWRRAADLAQGQQKLAELDLLQERERLVTWLAATAMIESAVADEPKAPEAWERDLLERYLQLSSQESAFGSFLTMTRIMVIQQGEAAQPIRKFAEQLTGLSAYGRKGVLWLSRRRLREKPPETLRLELLAGLVTVHRRDGEYEAMLRAATSLADVKPSATAYAYQAEAHFEADRLGPGDAALAEARRAGGGAALESAGLRRRLAEARRALKADSSGKAYAKLAATLVALGEPWRIRQTFSAKQVIALADPDLDAAYADALLDDGFDYEAAWAFASKARGLPPRADLIGRRIGSGLAVMLAELFRQRKLTPLVSQVKKQLAMDLKAFRKHDARLADLTSLYLRFMDVLAGKKAAAVATELAAEVDRFALAHPADMDGVQMAFLMGQLSSTAPDPWQVVKRFLDASRSGQIGDGFAALYASAAVRQALKTRKSDSLGSALAWLEGRKKASKDPGLVLWRAHLLATRALMMSGKAQAGQLQRAVDGYGKAIQVWGEAASSEQDPAILCSAATSLATLLMQGQALDQAAGLLDQVGPACAQDADSQAVGALVALAAGTQPDPGQPFPASVLAQAAPMLPARQAELQARLWLALVAESAKEPAQAKGQFLKAAEIMRVEQERGAPVLLAPDLLSMVALAGQFNMGTWHSPDSPFDLSVQVAVSARMVLFPPAAVDAKRLADYLKKEKK